MPKPKNDPIPIERLHELFILEPSTGVLRWRVKWRRYRRQGVGVEGVGSLSKGYVVVGIDGKQYSRHHLVWAMTTGIWPTDEIDHKDRIPGHDWFDNLRPATRSQQLANSGGRAWRNLPKGVYAKRNRWFASITVNYAQLYLGTFDTI